MALCVLDIRGHRRMALFEVYPLKFIDPNDPYYEILKWLHETGSHRNVFLQDSQMHWIWRIADWTVGQNIRDSFRGIENRQGDVLGTTFQGHLFRIDIESGELERIGWRKD